MQVFQSAPSLTLLATLTICLHLATTFTLGVCHTRRLMLNIELGSSLTSQVSKDRRSVRHSSRQSRSSRSTGESNDGWMKRREGSGESWKWCLLDAVGIIVGLLCADDVVDEDAVEVFKGGTLVRHGFPAAAHDVVKVLRANDLARHRSLHAVALANLRQCLHPWHAWEDGQKELWWPQPFVIT